MGDVKVGSNQYLLGSYDPRNYIPWSVASEDKAQEAESSLLSIVKTKLQFKQVKVRLGHSTLNTLTATPDSPENAKKTPIVLVHDLFLGLAVWNQNLDSLSQKRTTHAFDLLGWGRSSRADFSTDATLAELEWVQTFEDWRNEMNIDKMILVGHGFGGFLCASYALEHPSRVRHLTLVDPWGFVRKPVNQQSYSEPWIRFVGTFLSKFNALTFLRILGNFAPFILKIFRRDMVKRFKSANPEAIHEYIYQINASKPTGETGFHTLTYDFGWPKRPMADRFVGLDPRIPVTFICGSRSTISTDPFYEIQNVRSSYVNVAYVNGGHHVYADNADEFNNVMAEISELVDSNEDMEIRAHLN